MLHRVKRLIGPYLQSAKDRAHSRLRAAETDRLFELAMGQLASHDDGNRGDYHEYGIFTAQQFCSALRHSRRWGLQAMHFYAFDSFAGLPTDGSLCMSEDDFWKAVKHCGVDLSRIDTVKGYYKDTLTPEAQRKFIDAGRPIDVVNIDCDLHESAVEVFHFISPLLQPGSWVYVDDFHSTFRHGKRWGTARAFYEFADSHPTLSFHQIADIGWWGRSFIAASKLEFPINNVRPQ